MDILVNDRFAFICSFTEVPSVLNSAWVPFPRRWEGKPAQSQICLHSPTQGFIGASVVKNLPVKQETRVWSLSQKDPLETEMATHWSILAWEIPWTEKPGYSPLGHKELDTTWRLNSNSNSNPSSLLSLPYVSFPNRLLIPHVDTSWAGLPHSPSQMPGLAQILQRPQA